MQQMLRWWTLAALVLALMALEQPAFAQTPAPAKTTNPPVSAPPPNVMLPKKEPASPPPDLTVPEAPPEKGPKGRWGPIDQYNRNTKCYIAGKYVPAPPMCPN
jgi:hypothetical protein